MMNWISKMQSGIRNSKNMKWKRNTKENKKWKKWTKRTAKQLKKNTKSTWKRCTMHQRTSTILWVSKEKLSILFLNSAVSRFLIGWCAVVNKSPHKGADAINLCLLALTSKSRGKKHIDNGLIYQAREKSVKWSCFFTVTIGRFVRGKISRGLCNPRLLWAANCSYKRHF